MQVRTFIKPDRVALMLSRADRLGDRPRVFHDRYVAVVKNSEGTFTCDTLSSF